MYRRRGGWNYFMSEKRLQDYMLKNRVIRVPMYSYNIIIRFVIQMILPNSIRGFIFRKFFRKN